MSAKPRDGAHKRGGGRTPPTFANSSSFSDFRTVSPPPTTKVDVDRFSRIPALADESPPAAGRFNAHTPGGFSSSTRGATGCVQLAPISAAVDAYADQRCTPPPPHTHARVSGTPHSPLATTSNHRHTQSLLNIDTHLLRNRVWRRHASCAGQGRRRILYTPQRRHNVRHGATCTTHAK